MSNTLTVRSLAPSVYEGLKDEALRNHRSMEAEVREILRESVERRQGWRAATLADLSGDPQLSMVKTPFIRSADIPRHVE